MDIIAIVIVAYNRTESLKRLLQSISGSYFPSKNIPLIISIDHSDNQNVKETAKNFVWEFGEKEIIAHEKSLGLRNHILFCGNLTARYETIILLEDDLIVSPSFYFYALQTVKEYRTYSSVSGISLFSYRNNETSGLPFSTIIDEYDTYFMQVPSSWGQVWTSAQWNDFKKWYDTNDAVGYNDNLPNEVIKWPETSWKKYFWKYMVQNDKYFVYPQMSFSTNSGDAGQHHRGDTNRHQSDLGIKTSNYNFASIANSINIYDQFFEIKPSVIKSLVEYQDDITIDLHGVKPLKKNPTKYLLSIRNCSKPIKTYDITVFPIQLNIVLDFINSNNLGVLKLGLTENFEDTIDERLLEQISSRLDYRTFEYITQKGQMHLTKSDEYVIGTKWLKLIKKLPLPLQMAIRKTKLFNNPWK